MWFFILPKRLTVRHSLANFTEIPAEVSDAQGVLQSCCSSASCLPLLTDAILQHPKLRPVIALIHVVQHTGQGPGDVVEPAALSLLAKGPIGRKQQDKCW